MSVKIHDHMAELPAEFSSPFIPSFDFMASARASSAQESVLHRSLGCVLVPQKVIRGEQKEQDFPSLVGRHKIQSDFTRDSEVWETLGTGPKFPNTFSNTLIQISSFLKELSQIGPSKGRLAKIHMLTAHPAEGWPLTCHHPVGGRLIPIVTGGHGIVKAWPRVSQRGKGNMQELGAKRKQTGLVRIQGSRHSL